MQQQAGGNSKKKKVEKVKDAPANVRPGGSSFVTCPICNKDVHKALIEGHTQGVLPGVAQIGPLLATSMTFATSLTSVTLAFPQDVSQPIVVGKPQVQQQRQSSRLPHLWALPAPPRHKSRRRRALNELSLVRRDGPMTPRAEHSPPSWVSPLVKPSNVSTLCHVCFGTSAGRAAPHSLLRHNPT